MSLAFFGGDSEAEKTEEEAKQVALHTFPI
jgi:hypothetical protein